MNNHPKGKEQLTKKWSPRLVPAIDRVRNSSHHPDYVDYEEGGRWDEEGGPFEEVELGKVAILIRGFGGDGEVGVYPSKDFEKALDDSEKMGRDTTDDPKLFVPPPLVYADAAPPHLKYAGGKDGEKEGDKPDTCKVTNLQNMREMRESISMLFHICC